MRQAPISFMMVEMARIEPGSSIYSLTVASDVAMKVDVMEMIKAHTVLILVKIYTLKNSRKIEKAYRVYILA